MRLSAKAPIVIRGEEITHLDADGYKHLPRATSLPDGKVLATSGGKWGASDLSGVSVASVFGRTGAVAAQTGDYTAAQVGAEPYAGAPAQTSFWRSTAAGVRAWVQLVAADITDLATVLAGYLTKLNPTFTGVLTGPTAAFTNITWTTAKATGLAAATVRPATIGTDGLLGAQDAAMFRGTIGALAASLKGATNGVAELGADGKVPSAQLPASSSPIVSVAKTMEFALANEATPSPVQILTVPVPVGFFTTNGLIELDLDLDFLYVASGNRITLSFEVGVSMMWLEWNDDIPADAPRVFHGYIGKYKVESGETYVRMIGTLNGVRVSGEYHDVTSTVAGQTSFSVSGHVVIEGAGAHVNCAVGKVFA